MNLGLPFRTEKRILRALNESSIIIIDSNLDFSKELTNWLKSRQTKVDLISTKEGYLEIPNKNSINLLVLANAYLNWWEFYYAYEFLLNTDTQLIVFGMNNIVAKGGGRIISVDVPSNPIEVVFGLAGIPGIMELQAAIDSINPEAVIVPDVLEKFNWGIKAVTRRSDITGFTKILDSDLDENLEWMAPEILVKTQMRLGLNITNKVSQYYHLISYDAFSRGSYKYTMDKISKSKLDWVNGTDILGLENYKYFLDIWASPIVIKFISYATDKITTLIGCILAQRINLDGPIYKRFANKNYNRVLVGLAKILLEELGDAPDSKQIWDWSTKNFLLPEQILGIYRNFTKFSDLPETEEDPVKMVSEIVRNISETDQGLIYQYSIPHRGYVNKFGKVKYPVSEKNIICLIKGHPLELSSN